MCFLQAENLKENVFYQFQVRAMNMAGVSKASVASAALECKEWTITVPGRRGRVPEVVDFREKNTMMTPHDLVLHFNNTVLMRFH